MLLAVSAAVSAPGTFKLRLFFTHNRSKIQFVREVLIAKAKTLNSVEFETTQINLHTPVHHDFHVATPCVMTTEGR